MYEDEDTGWVGCVGPVSCVTAIGDECTPGCSCGLIRDLENDSFLEDLEADDSNSEQDTEGLADGATIVGENCGEDCQNISPPSNSSSRKYVRTRRNMRRRLVSTSEAEMESCRDKEDDLVTCVFSWMHGGHEVSMSGSFTDWDPNTLIPLVKTGHNFITVRELPRGIHYYKFIVDGVWKSATDQPIVKDGSGFTNNVLDITDYERLDFTAYHYTSESHPAAATGRSGGSSSSSVSSTIDFSKFSQNVPSREESGQYDTTPPLYPTFFQRTPSPATHPPPRIAAPLHFIANNVFHDFSSNLSLGPQLSVVSVTHRYRPSCFRAENKHK